MHGYRHMMVALAKPEADAGLIRYAAMAARCCDADEVRFVHVLAPVGSVNVTANHDSALAALTAAVQSHFGHPSTAIKLSYDVLAGPLIDRLLTHIAEKAVDLLLVGEQHRPDGRRLLARRLVMKAPCSVWMVPEDSPPRIQRLLVPIDFSEPAADSLRAAIALARRVRHPECLALHVYFNKAAVTYEEYDQVLRGEEEAAYRRFIAPIDHQGVRVKPLFQEGANIEHVVSDAVEQHGADLIVIATRGRSRSAAILLGSVTEEILLTTGVPLLAVKHFGARMGVVQALLDRRFWDRGSLHTD
jgi:sulfate permease, SulP family